MRKILWIAGLFLNSFAFGQVTERFSDGELLHQPAWEGDLNRFYVNTAQQLQSKIFNSADTAYISVNNKKLLNTIWDFYIQLNMDPSSSNFVRFYLSSDKADLTGSLNGYFLQIGESGSQDSYDLYKQTGTNIIKIIDGAARARTHTDTIKAWFRIIHLVDGHWEVHVKNTFDNQYETTGIGNDRSFISSNYAGVYLRHTALRSDKYIFDDIDIYDYETDEAAPEITDVEVTTDTSLYVLFTEDLDTLNIYNTNLYLLDHTINPKSVSFDPALRNVIKLFFEDAFLSGLHRLTFPVVTDLFGNSTDTPLIKHFQYYPPKSFNERDIIFTEIFPDFSPSVGLPSAEFTEIYNNTEESINLSGWKYTDGTSRYTFGDVNVDPQSYMILCKREDTALYAGYGTCLGLNIWPSLNNTSDQLTLSDYNGKIIDRISYDLKWYKNKEYQNGGRSLELQKSNGNCDPFYYWAVSLHEEGGTPGKINSIFTKDLTEQLNIQQIQITNDSTIYISFNSIPDTQSCSNIEYYSLENGFPYASKIIWASSYRSIEIIFSGKFKRGEKYELLLKNIKSCDQNPLEKTQYSLHFESHDDTSKIRINEIMVDPSPQVGLPLKEYIELYNTTNHDVDLGGWEIYVGNSKAVLPSFKLRSNEYAIMCKASDSLLFQPYGRTIGMVNFPGLNNAQEELILKNKAGRTIDSLIYNDD